MMRTLKLSVSVQGETRKDIADELRAIAAEIEGTDRLWQWKDGLGPIGLPIQRWKLDDGVPFGTRESLERSLEEDRERQELNRRYNVPNQYLVALGKDAGPTVKVPCSATTLQKIAEIAPGFSALDGDYLGLCWSGPAAGQVGSQISDLLQHDQGVILEISASILNRISKGRPKRTRRKRVQ